MEPNGHHLNMIGVSGSFKYDWGVWNKVSTLGLQLFSHQARFTDWGWKGVTFSTQKEGQLLLCKTTHQSTSQRTISY